MRSKELEAYKEKLKLSKEQREVIVGLALGDAHLESWNGQVARIKVEQSEAHKAYVMHLYQLLQEWVRTPPRRKCVRSRGTESWNWWFQSLSHGAFRFYWHQFYQDGRKCIPALIHHWLTPRALAYWYMDDGSIKSAQSKAVLFNTQGYTQQEVMRLCNVLKVLYNLKAKPRKQKEGHQIFISGESYDDFGALVRPFLIPEMLYKLPGPRRT